MSTLREWVVPAEAAGERLDRHVAASLVDISRTQVVRLIDRQMVRVDGRAAAASHRLRGGEVVACEVPERTTALVPEAGDLRVLHEDDDVLVIDKPAGILVHPGAGRPSGTLAHALLHHCGPALAGVGGEARPGIVHRLDKGTTGALVVAKTPRAYRELTAQFAERTVSKTYHAVVLGHPPAVGRVDAPIGRSPLRRTRMAVVERGRPAVTEWSVLERFGRSAAWLRVALLTGRTHQARVHLAHAGHAIVGDVTYRASSTAAEPRTRAVLARFPRPALHAFRIGFTHPATRAWLEVEAPLPEDMRGLMDELRGVPS